MLFNSWSFIPFILVVLSLYYWLPARGQNMLVLVASYVFYGAWDWRFLLLLMFSTSVDYIVGLKIGATDDEAKRKRILFISIAMNLTLLGFFKYYNFFSDSFVGLLGMFGLKASHAVLRVILPVGISFYTFQSMSYTIDVYRRRQPALKSLLLVATYVAFFPQLVAGPIERAVHIIPQIVKKRTPTVNQVQEGLWLILWGMFKKVVIADNLAIYVDRGFGITQPNGGVHALLTLYAFALQIYGDFSGYTDIARGLAKLLGVEIMLNFNRPYLAKNPTEFWHRWHISLSTWLRDYLYIPLGGNRKGEANTYRNLMLTMLLGGLWHGAAWTFVIWGFYHGALLAIHRFLTHGRQKPAREPSRLTAILSTIGMFQLTCFGWLLFRASSLGQVGSFLRQIFTNPTWNESAAQVFVPLLGLGFLLFGMESWVQNRDNPVASRHWTRGWGPVAVGGLILLVMTMAPASARSFIYFQF